MTNQFQLLSCLLVLCCLACHTEVEDCLAVSPLEELTHIPKGFPAIDYPEGNEFTLARWELGKQLFFDPILSVDSSVSCASCHQPDLAFSDEFAVSLGVSARPGNRNSPSLANVAYHPYFTREGGVPTLEMQVLVPIQEHQEFDFNIVPLSTRLQEDSHYVALALEAYNLKPNPFVITRALACFERSLISGNSPYDQYVQNQKESALSVEAKAGRKLFFSDRTNCSECHGGFNFTNYAFENNGLYETYADEGRFRLTGKEVDRALFKVPSLRNIAVTGPYMHDGSMDNLEAVIEHYSTGGKNHPHKSALLKPLNLTTAEQTALLAFLTALTDENFIRNPLFRE
ncbi:MAG: cytochrome-c peroxidase [Saprospiraceae bacterium]